MRLVITVYVGNYRTVRADWIGPAFLLSYLTAINIRHYVSEKACGDCSTRRIFNFPVTIYIYYALRCLHGTAEFNVRRFRGKMITHIFCLLLASGRRQRSQIHLYQWTKFVFIKVSCYIERKVWSIGETVAINIYYVIIVNAFKLAGSNLCSQRMVWINVAENCIGHFNLRVLALVL